MSQIDDIDLPWPDGHRPHPPATVDHMLQALRTFGRILARHWPALIAWFLGGEALHQLLVQLAGTVGGQTTLGGLLLLPLAVAARLISYVAMYLTVRPSLPHGNHDASGGYKEFASAVLVAILPFSAFYAAWGMMTADQYEFFNIAAAIALRETGYGTEALGDRGGLVSAGLLPVAVLVIALAARLLLSHFQKRLPTWTLALAAYVELLWTFMLFTLVGQWWASTQDWISGLALTQWLNDIGDWVAMTVPPAAAIWEAGVWAVGFIGAAILVPAAWLTIAGVIYGTAFDAPPAILRLGEGRRGVSRALMTRFEDLWAAVAVVWRGGPVLFGSAVLAYALWTFAERAGTRAVLVAVGGHDTDFWSAFLPLILVGVAAIAEPLRVAIVATAYDAVVARPSAGLESAPAGPAAQAVGSGGEGEAGHTPVSRNVEQERPRGVVG